MTDLAALWQAERTARAQRAAAAIAAGRATADQAERDAHLCTLIAAAIASGFRIPTIASSAAEVADHAAAADLLDAIASKARTDQRAEAAALQRLASLCRNPLTIVQAAIANALAWQARQTSQ